MKRWTLLASLFACLVTAGCFEMKQDIKFNSDGTVDATVRIAIDAALVAMGNRSDNSFCMNDLGKNDGITGTSTATTEGGDMICTITISGPMDRVVEVLSETTLNEKSEQTQGFSLSRDGDAYIVHIELPPPDQTAEEGDSQMAKAMQAMMLAKMSGRALAWTVTAPEIIETSGKISDDGTVATYSRPVADAFTSTEPTRFEVKFSLREKGFLRRVKALFQ
jgi:hypothetical protein